VKRHSGLPQVGDRAGELPAPLVAWAAEDHPADGEQHLTRGGMGFSAGVPMHSS